nr:immunoglobulin light chain junction region [Macaca mulatta]
DYYCGSYAGDNTWLF